jgi:hypothetical protein
VRRVAPPPHHLPRFLPSSWPMEWPFGGQENFKNYNIILILLKLFGGFGINKTSLPSCDCPLPHRENPVLEGKNSHVSPLPHGVNPLLEGKKLLSPLFHPSSFYSTLAPRTKREIEINQLNLYPYWVTGFADAPPTSIVVFGTNLTSTVG